MLGYEKNIVSESNNSRNGYSKKTIKSELGLILTTNIIKTLNSQFRKVTKTKLIFPNDESLMKVLYLATEKIHSKWTRDYANWDLVINELNIIFA